MRNRPALPTDTDVLASARDQWLEDAESAEYLPIGFGAHHWRIMRRGVPVFFATLDRVAHFRTAGYFRRAYSGAATLADNGVSVVIAPCLSARRELVIPLYGDLLSLTPWVDGYTPDQRVSRSPDHLSSVLDALRELHSATPPQGFPRWFPRMDHNLFERQHASLDRPWRSGPLGEQARQLLIGHQKRITRWFEHYQSSSDLALSTRDRWVPTHGEPHHANQLVTADGLKLVDWESLALAPPERDFVDLPLACKVALNSDLRLVRLFELEWKLTEIHEYTEWFSQPHTGNEDDLLALDGLREELTE